MPTKVHLVKAMVFPVVMYGCESWTVKKVEWWRIDAFELWCWRRLLRVPWTARRSVLHVHWKDWCWSWNSNTLASWCKELTHLKRLWCWERLRAGGEGDDRGWDGWMASLTQWTWVSVDSGSPGVLRFMGLQRVGHNWATELNWTSNWTTTIIEYRKLPFNPFSWFASLTSGFLSLCQTYLLVLGSTESLSPMDTFLRTFSVC